MVGEVVSGNTSLKFMAPPRIFPQWGRQSSLPFRERSEEIPDIPLTDDFQQEYTRVAQEP